jgi:hypothetical protein
LKKIMYQGEIDLEETRWPSITRKERNRREFSAAMKTGLAAICGVAAAVLTLRGDGFALIAYAATTVNALNARDDLRKVRELEAEEAEAREKLISSIIEARKRFEEREAGEGDTRAPYTATAVPLPREGGFTGEPYGVARVSRHVIHLALHHRKARVRKKNANRIIKEEKGK